MNTIFWVYLNYIGYIKITYSKSVKILQPVFK